MKLSYLKMDHVPDVISYTATPDELPLIAAYLEAFDIENPGFDLTRRWGQFYVYGDFTRAAAEQLRQFVTNAAMDAIELEVAA